jgi:hypothetical protein
VRNMSDTDVSVAEEAGKHHHTIESCTGMDLLSNAEEAKDSVGR